jgi:hypothetical protein
LPAGAGRKPPISKRSHLFAAEFLVLRDATTLALPVPFAKQGAESPRGGWLVFDVPSALAERVPHGPVSLTYSAQSGGAPTQGGSMVCFMRRRLRNARVRLFFRQAKDLAAE